jgi:diguanylate cyclase (GGDEF)-like protein
VQELADPRPSWLPSPVSAYAGSVGVLGVLVLLAVAVLDNPLPHLAHHPVEVGALAVALIASETMAIPLPRGDGTSVNITISTIFALALLVLGPLSFVLLAHAAAVVVDDARSRRPLQVLFNIGQYSLSLAVARWVYCGLSGAEFLGGYTPFDGGHLLPALAAGAAFAIVNDGLVSVVLALAAGERLRRALARDPRFKLGTAGLLVALAPVAATVLQESVLMLPLLILPILSVGRAAHLAVEREKQSLHDPLTGLANRALFRLRLERALAAREAGGVAVLMLDLDYFKDINDTLGHHVGDELLCTVAGRLTEAVHDYGREMLVARLGGDEFAVLLVGDAPTRHATAFADLLLARFSQPLDVHGTRLAVHTSIGITTDAGAPLKDVHTALKQADIALYEAKQERARAAVYDERRMTHNVERVRLLPQLQEAIEKGEIVVHYQPQVDAGSGRVVAVEALVRWQHPVQGLLPPATFVDLAENSGLIVPITTFVLREALAAARTWRSMGHDVGVSVNLSARQLSDLALPEHVARVLAASGVPASALTVEVTESSLMTDARAARAILHGLRALGVQLSIDDFGTGYSSLALLQQLDVDELKIDRSFIQGMASSGHDETLVRSVIELAHNIGLAVVAEGVETTGIASQLAALGCERLQGYLFGRPLPQAELTHLLHSQSAGVAVAASGR